FHMAQANNKIILPNINCGGTCLNAGPGPVNYNKDFDQMRDRIWRLFGSPDLTDSKDYVPSADAVLTVANNNGGSLLLQNIQNDGVFGNTGILTFINVNPTGGTVHSVACDPFNKTIDVSLDDDALIDDVRAEIQTACGSFVSV